MNGLIAILVIGLMIVLTLWWMVNTQRALVKRDELCKNAMSQIGVQLNSRWDALTALADLTKSYSEHEYNALKDIIGARTKITSNSTAQDVAIQESRLGSIMGRLFAVSEAYPQLKANETYIHTMNSVKSYEENVRLAREVYNDTVTRMNAMVRQFPTSLIASRLGFGQKEYLQEPQGKTEMPNMMR